MAFTGGYNDRGKVLTPGSVTTGPWSDVTAYTAGSEIQCRARQMASREVADNGGIVVTDWEVQVPAGTTIDNIAGFRITRHRFTATTIDVLLVGRPRVSEGQITFNAKSAPSLSVS